MPRSRFVWSAGRAALALVLASPLTLAAGCDDGAPLTNAGNASWVTQSSAGVHGTLVSVGPGLGIPSSDLYAVGEGSLSDAPILKYDGKAWAAARPTVMGCLTCRSPGTINRADLQISAGPRGTVNRFDTMTMSWHSENTGLEGDVLALWAADATRIFAVADGGGIAQYQGGRWTVMKSPTGSSLRSVFGASAIDVFAVGDLGTVVHFDGSAWTVEESGTTARLRDVWGSSALGFFAVGELGTILHHAGF